MTAQPQHSPVPIGSNPAIVDEPNGHRTSFVGSAQPLPSNMDSTPSSTYNREQTEEEELAKAIRLSLQNQSKSAAKGATALAGRSGVDQSSNEQSIDLVLSLSNEFDALDAPTGDTAIYIGPPPQQPEQSDNDYRYIRAHFDRVYVVDSRTLRLMGEESKFTEKELLNPSKSFRSQRRLRKDHPGVLEKVEQKRGETFRFAYYIDLRPAQEDEEAVILLTELTCTRGVLAWHLAKDKYDLVPLNVIGRDEFGTPPSIPVQLQQDESATAADDGIADPTESALATQNNDLGPPKPKPQLKPPPEIAPEYSALRHRSGLERLVHAIQGNDPKLDSAPKLWTFFALARFFGCAGHHRISGWITTWLYSGNNANFIQNNPEVAYRIAMGIRSPDLLKDSFSILVGERALLEAYGEYQPKILNPLRRNVHGRKLELLDDDERNRIDHAASSFVKRIREITGSMCREMDFLHESTAYQTLAEIVGHSPEEVDILDEAKKTIREYIRSRIYYVLCQEQYQIECHEADLVSTLPFRSAVNEGFYEVYKSLNQPMRLFTKTFWIALQNTRFDVYHSNLVSTGTIGFYDDTRYTQGLKGLYKDDPVNGITQILRSTFNNKIAAVNLLLYRREVVENMRKERFEECLQELRQANNTDSAMPRIGSLTVRNPSSPESPSRPEPNPPFARELKETAKPSASGPVDLFASELHPATKGSAFRFEDEDCSPIKRRKTSEDGGFAESIQDGATPAPIHSNAALPKKVSFAVPSKANESSMKDSADASDMFSSSPGRGSDSTASEKKRDSIGLGRPSCGNSAPVKPVWTSKNGPLEPLPPTTTTTMAMGQPTLTLRPKQPTSVEPVPMEHPVSSTAEEKETDLGSAGRYRYSEVYQGGAGVRYDSGSNPKPMTAAEELASDQQTAATLSLPNQPTGWLSSPKKFFNHWSGNWDTWGTKNEGGTQSNPIQNTPRPPLSSMSGKRVVKQAFSNTTVDDSIGPLDLRPESDRRCRPISPDTMLYEVQQAIGKICSSILHPPHLFHQTCLLPTNLFDTLLCLNENEYRYLPLWAPDGNDDGTGGVFDEMPVPNLDPASAGIESFRPGRIRRGYQNADSVMSGSEYEEIGSSQAISTVGKASKLATDGTHTVTSLSSIASVFNAGGTDAGTVVPDNDDTASDDALSIIHVGEDARGSNDDEMNVEDELEFEDENNNSDNDTINGDDPLEKEMSASLQAFLGRDVQAEQSVSTSTSTSPHNKSRSKDHTDLNTIRAALPAIEKVAEATDIDEDRSKVKEDKGKAKAQNHPHGVPDFDLTSDHDFESHELPYRERGGLANPLQPISRPAPSQSTPSQPTQQAWLSTSAGYPGSKLTDEEEGYEFL